jgi:Plant transposon protein
MYIPTALIVECVLDEFAVSSLLYRALFRSLSTAMAMVTATDCPVLACEGEVLTVQILAAASVICFKLIMRRRARTRRGHGGSRFGKLPNRDIGREQAAARLDQDYFARSGGAREPSFNHLEFERRFRMPRDVYETIRAGVMEYDTCFVQKPDVTGLNGASTDQKIVAALRQMSLGVGGDAVVEYVKLSESTCNEALHRFAAATVAAFKPDYLRLPNMDELREIEDQYRSLGFPGCIGCVDVASWEWDCCPVSWHGQHKGKDKKPCCRMELLCDAFLYIYHVMFGTPGSKNDINVMNSSTLFDRVRAEKWPPARSETIIGGFPLTWFFFLVDGIYPRFRIFVSSISPPRNMKEKVFSSRQESARKAAERVFGVLFKRFGIFYRPSRLWHKYEMAVIVEACCIINNMIVKARKEDYTGTR